MTAQQQYKILNKQTAAKKESAGFNLDSLKDQSIEDLFSSYDQVQVRNGNQNLLLQRSTADNTVAPKTDINGQGNLQVLPDAGGKAAAAQQTALAARKQALNTETPLQKYGPIVAVGGAGVVILVLILKLHHGG